MSINDLDKIGEIYTRSINNVSIPAGVNTQVLRQPEVPFGTYIIVGKFMLKTAQPAGGAIFGLVCPNANYNLEIPPISFLGNGTLTGIAKFTQSTDNAQLYYFSQAAVTIDVAEIIMIRIS